MSALVPLPQPSACPALIAAAGDRAQRRFLELFASDIRNPHTRCSYVRAVGEFLDWCATAGIPSIVDVEPLHVDAWIEGQTRRSGICKTSFGNYAPGLPLSAHQVRTPRCRRRAEPGETALFRIGRHRAFVKVRDGCRYRCT